jgi:peptidoglycan hydrolase-like protein with peptidoglycan-binding domain
MNKRVAAVGAAAVVVAALAVAAARPFSGGAKSGRTLVPTSLAWIVRTDVVERQQVTGTLSYSGGFSVANAGAAATVTWLPEPGAIVRRGQPLYELDHVPAVLLYAAGPAYRDLAYGSVGPDVRALQRNLVVLGFGARVDGRFDVATLAAVEAWQRAHGPPPTGTLPLGSVVFLPGAARVATLTAAAGAPVQAGAPVLTATSANPAVLVPLDPGTVSQLAVGDHALVSTPDGRTISGTVASIGRVATAPPDTGQGGGPPTVPVTIDLPHAETRGGLDQTPVQVAITAAEDRHVLAVPISALLAEPGGGYAVQVVTAGIPRLVRVTTGLFDDVAGRVEISGPALAPGLRVEVPSG